MRLLILALVAAASSEDEVVAKFVNRLSEACNLHWEDTDPDASDPAVFLQTLEPGEETEASTFVGHRFYCWSPSGKHRVTVADAGRPQRRAVVRV